MEGGFISESAVNSIYPLDNEVSLIYLLGILNSKSCNYISKMLSPTLGVSPEDMKITAEIKKLHEETKKSGKEVTVRDVCKISDSIMKL